MSRFRRVARVLLIDIWFTETTQAKVEAILRKDKVLSAQLMESGKQIRASICFWFWTLCFTL